jgi:ABC-type lipoprotein export system ATPase subunit
VEDKEFKFNKDGEFQAFKDNKRIETEQLSSGEKQLLILLTETSLQMGSPFVFLADEPEISLHIEWQEKIISSIRTLNKKAQVIVATHSPEIAGGWNNRIIDMEDIFDE